MLSCSCRQQLCHGAPGQPASLPLRCPSQQHLPDSSSLQRPGQQHLPDGSSLQRPCRQSPVPTVPCLQQLRRSAPPSNKPHLAEKSTPVWLAIWRTWAGFANSQHRDAAFATPDNICAHSSLLQHGAAAQTDANLSAHLHRLPTPPPYLRQMRLLPGWDAGVGCWIWLPLGLVRRSCKSPRARILVLGTSGAHWPARWPQFELTEQGYKS